MTLSAPFPWFGGKSKVAGIVWEAFGPVRNYVEPFFGSGAVLLGRPTPPKIETICDRDAYVANFWRATKWAAAEVARWADWPVSEADLTARHRWLVKEREKLNTSLMEDPHFFNAKVAGWWVWGLSQWIGSGWCGKAGSQLPRAYAAGGQGVHRVRVPRQVPRIASDGGGLGTHGADKRARLVPWFLQLQARLRSVRRVECSDWTRVMGDSVILGAKKSTFITGVFLDPPYPGKDERQADLYSTDCLDVGKDVRTWSLENGDNPRLRIALCGYEGPEMPGWREVAWKTAGGYGNQGNGRGKANAERERIWFSPHCLSRPEWIGEAQDGEQLEVFAGS